MASRQFNLADLFEVVVDTVPDRLALVAGPVRLTYRQLDQRANRFAHYLGTRGIGTGAHVGILAHNCAEWAEAMIGCYKARTVPVNLNFRYVAAELRYVIDNADLEMLVFERALSPLVAESIPDHGGTDPIPLVVIDDGSPEADLVPTAVRYEVALASRRSGPGLRATVGRRHLRALHRWHHRDAQGCALATGGHLLRRHGRGWMGCLAHQPPPTSWPSGINPDDTRRVVMLVVAPLMHGNAQWVMWNAFMMGGTAVLYTDHRYDPDSVWRLVGDEGVVSMGLVGDAMARPLADALAAAAARHLRHLHPGRDRLGRSHALVNSQGRTEASNFPTS